MLLRGLCAVIGLVVLLGEAAAGPVLRVGPNRIFKNINVALRLAVQDNTVILVDQGLYPPVTVRVSKSVAILPAARGGTYQIQSVPGVPSLTVEYLPAGKSVSIHGAVIHYVRGNISAARVEPAVRIRKIAGTLRFNHVKVWTKDFFQSVKARAVIDIVDSPSIWMNHLEVETAGAIGSTFTLPRHYRPAIQGAVASNTGLSGILLENSTGILQNTRAKGFDSQGSFGGDGIRLVDSRVWVIHTDYRWGKPSLYQGGQGTIFGGNSVHHVTDRHRPPKKTIGGLLTCEKKPTANQIHFEFDFGATVPGWVIASNNNSGRAGATRQAMFHDIPSKCLLNTHGFVEISSAEPQKGNKFTLDTYSAEKRLYIPGIGVARYHPQHLNGGVFAVLDISSTILGHATNVDYQGHRIEFKLPNDPAMVGMQLAAQSIFLPAASASVTVSLPEMWVIRP